MADVSAPVFWQDLYESRGDGWELGGASPVLRDVLDTMPPPPGRVAVPGCGRGHDARLLASRGYPAVGFDFAPAAVAEARRLAAAEGVPATFEQRDIFSLGGAYRHVFDGVWEYTCFCAIDPRRRDEYVTTVATILRPGGWFLACFYPVRRHGPPGPPFPVDRDEVRRLLEPRFAVQRAFVPSRSVQRRTGREWLVHAVRTSAPAALR